MPRRTALLVVALLTVWTAARATDVVTLYRAGDARGTIFDGEQPRTNPKECWFTVFDTGHGRVITIATDQPFRADKEAEYIAGTGSRYKAISFKIPAVPPEGAGERTSKDDQGYVVKYLTETGSKALEEGPGTRLVVKYDGDTADILKDVAEIIVTPDLIPVSVKVESLTRSGRLNKKSKLTCGEFSKVEDRSPSAEASPEEAPGGQDAGTPGLAGEQAIFWQSLHSLCEKAYAHVQSPPVPTRPVLDVRRCDDSSVTLGVHYLVGGEEGKWNRSQTWVISKADGGLHMEYAQRQSTDPAARRSGWSATTKDAGGAETQVFLPDPKVLETSPALAKFGWVLRIQSADAGPTTLLYQAVERTDAGEQSRGGYLFDLATPIDPPEEPPWGLGAAPPSNPPAVPAGTAPANPS